jgi:hypothetical protein
MFANSSNAEDVKKYYHQTWVKFPKLSGDTLWFISNVSHDFLEILSDNGEEALIDLKRGQEMEYVIPKKTIYQFGEKAAFLSRVPARQWKKGMCGKNTRFQTLSLTKWDLADFDISIIAGFVNKPSYLDFYALAKEWSQGKFETISAALTPRIACSYSGSIFIDDTLVGKYDLDKNILTTREIYKENLQPLFYKSKLKVLSSV